MYVLQLSSQPGLLLGLQHLARTDCILHRTASAQLDGMASHWQGVFYSMLLLTPRHLLPMSGSILTCHSLLCALFLQPLNQLPCSCLFHIRIKHRCDLQQSNWLGHRV